MGGVRAQGMEAMHARRGYNQFGAFVEQHHVVRFLRACRLKWISVPSLLFFQRRTASCRSGAWHHAGAAHGIMPEL